MSDREDLVEQVIKEAPGKGCCCRRAETLAKRIQKARNTYSDDSLDGGAAADEMDAILEGRDDV